MLDPASKVPNSKGMNLHFSQVLKRHWYYWSGSTPGEHHCSTLRPQRKPAGWMTSTHMFCLCSFKHFELFANILILENFHIKCRSLAYIVHVQSLPELNSSYSQGRCLKITTLLMGPLHSCTITWLSTVFMLVHNDPLLPIL